MNRKFLSALKIVAILLVLLAVLMHLQVVIIPAIAAYKFWMVVIAFAMVLLTTK